MYAPPTSGLAESKALRLGSLPRGWGKVKQPVLVKTCAGLTGGVYTAVAYNAKHALRYVRLLLLPPLRQQTPASIRRF
jgi:hypothetical protein